ERGGTAPEQVDLGFCTNDAAVWGPSQERRTDEHIDDALAGSRVKAQQAARLRRRQSQTRHLVKLRTYPLNQYWEVHADFEARGRPVDRLRRKCPMISQLLRSVASYARAAGRHS